MCYRKKEERGRSETEQGKDHTRTLGYTLQTKHKNLKTKSVELGVEEAACYVSTRSGLSFQHLPEMWVHLCMPVPQSMEGRELDLGTWWPTSLAQTTSVKFRETCLKTERAIRGYGGELYVNDKS